MGITLPNEIKSKKFYNVEQNDTIQIDNASGIIGFQAKVNDDETAIVDNFVVNTTWVDQDLKYMITKFVVDTESTSGHFTDGTNRISIKNVGTDNPYVEEKVLVAFLDGVSTRYGTINTITNDGDQDDEVIFTEGEGAPLLTGTYDVVSIKAAVSYEYETDVGALGLYSDFNDNKEISITLGTTDIVNIAADTYRIAIPYTEFDNDASTISIRAKTSDDAYIYNKVSIGERQMTLDDWNSSFQGTALAPRRVVIQKNILRLGLELSGGGDIDNASMVNQSVTSLTPADVYHFSCITKATTAGNKLIIAFMYTDTDEYWYNFTGVNAGTYTIAAQPSSDQLHEITLTDEYATYTPALAQIPVGTTGEINTYIIAFDADIRIAEVTMKKDGTGTNILTNDTLDQWTGTANYVSIPTEITFGGVRNFNGYEFVSDSLIFNLEYGYDYMITLDTAVSATEYMQYGTNAGYTTYHKVGAQSYNQKDLTSITNTYADTAYGISRIQINYGKVVTGKYFTSHNTINAANEATLDFTIDTIIKDITTDCNAYISFSTDGGFTYKVYDKTNKVFYDIASNKNSVTGLTEGVWCYKTYSSGLWTELGADFSDANTAISKALEVSSQYRYDIQYIDEIEFTDPNGFVQGDSFSFAYTLTASNEDIINNIYITNYTRYDTIKYMNAVVDDTIFEAYSLDFDNPYSKKTIYVEYLDTDTLPILYVYYF